MDVILLERVGKLGELGEKVSVKAGFGRNYLLPQSMAVPATKDNLVAFEARRAELEANAQAKLAKAEKRAESLAALSVTIPANAGEEGKLFGSIGTRDVAEHISSAGVDVTKSEVRMPEGVIRDLGEYEIVIQVHSDVSQVVKVSVIQE